MGATCEWVRGGRNGELTEFHPSDYMVHTIEMVRYIVHILENPKYHAKLIRGALKTKILTWQEVGAKWNKIINRYA